MKQLENAHSIAQSGTGIAVQIVLGVAILSFFVLRYRDLKRALDGIREAVSHDDTRKTLDGAENGVERV